MCTGAVICVLRIGDIFLYWSLYFCTEINISVLEYILFYCVYFTELIYILTPTTDEYVVEIDIVIEPCMLIYSDVIAKSSRPFFLLLAMFFDFLTLCTDFCYFLKTRLVLKQ